MIIYYQTELPACLWNLVQTEFSVVFLNFEEVYWVPQGLTDNEQDLKHIEEKNIRCFSSDTFFAIMFTTSILLYDKSQMPQIQ